MAVLTYEPEEVYASIDGSGNPASPSLDKARTLAREMWNAIGSFGGPDNVRQLGGNATETLTSTDMNSVIIVNTLEPSTLGEIDVFLPALSSLDASISGRLAIYKTKSNTHPGKMVVSAPRIATTGTVSASSTSLVVADATGIAVGDVVLAIDTGTWRPKPGLQNETRVASIAGTTITLDKAASIALAGATVHFYHDSISGGGPRAFEIPGQGLVLAADRDNNNWEIVSLTLSATGGPITGHHSVPGGVYNATTNPWPADPATQNTQMFEFTPDSGGATTNLRANLAHPNSQAAGYAPGTLTLMRSDKYAAYLPLFYTPNATWSQADTNTYPNVLEGFADVEQLYCDGSEYRTISEYDAHRSGICDVVLSYQSSPPDSVTCPTAAGTIYLVPRNICAGDRIAIINSTQTTNYTWRVRHTHGSIAKLLSSSTYGYAASPNATHNVYVWVAPDGSLQVVLGAANAGTGEYTQVDSACVNTSALAGGILAKSARLVGFILTNGSSQATQVYTTRIEPTFFSTGYPGSGTSAARIGVNTPPPTAGNPTWRLYAAYPDAFVTLEFYGGGGIAQSHLSADTTQLAIKTIGSFPINFGTNNTTRLTIAADGGLYTANATGGSKGVDTVNAKGVYVDGKGVAYPLSVQKSGNTNDSASGSGSYFDHDLTYTIPANLLTDGKILEITTMWRLSTGSGPPANLGFRLKAGATSLIEFLGSAPMASASNLIFVERYYLVAKAAPSGSSAVDVGVVGSSNSYGASTIFNQISQPVNLATNGALTLTFSSRWNAAGTGGTSSVELRHVDVKSIN